MNHTFSIQKIIIMTFLEKLQLIERMDQLIRLKATGTSKDLASRLGISRSTVFEIHDTMRKMGAEIDYCKFRKSYYYVRDKVLAIGFVDEKKIKGGKKIEKNILESGFFGLPYNIFAFVNVSPGMDLNPPKDFDQGFRC